MYVKGDGQPTHSYIPQSPTFLLYYIGGGIFTLEVPVTIFAKIFNSVFHQIEENCIVYHDPWNKITIIALNESHKSGGKKYIMQLYMY